MDPRVIKSTRRNKNTIHHAKFNKNIPTSEEAKAVAENLQRKIIKKEQELNKAKELLARNDATDITEAQIELNKLQEAFEKTKKRSDSQLDPVIRKLHSTQSELEGKKHKLEMYNVEAKERDKSLTRMQKKINEITADLDAPTPIKSDESQVRPILRDFQKVQNESEKLHRKLQMNNYTMKSFAVINDSLNSLIKESLEKENRANRRATSLRQENEAKLNKPRQEIDDEWILARHRMDKLRIMLEDAKHSVKHLSDTADQLALSNRKATEELSATSDEMKIYQKFLPGSGHDELGKKTEGISRTDLTVLESQKELTEQVLSVGRMKTKAIKSTLEALRNKVAEVPNLVRKAEQEAEQTKIERENAESALTLSHQLRAELLSQKSFSEQELTLLRGRVEEQRQLLDDILKKTEEANNELEKQKTIIQMNEEMQNLKTMNFDRFTSTISNLMAIHNKM